MLNYGIRYECTPFSPAGADYPPPPAPQPRLSGSSLQPHPPAPVLHNPGVVLLPVSPPGKFSATQFLDPQFWTLRTAFYGTSSLSPGSIPLRAPPPPKYLSTAFYADFLSLPGKHASTSPPPRAKKPPKPVENLRAGPVLDCAEIHIRGSKTALFDPFEVIPHPKTTPNPRPSIEKTGSVQEKGLWKILHRLLLRLPLSRHIPSSRSALPPCECLVVSFGTNCLSGNEIDGIRLSMDHLGYLLKRVST